MFFYPVVIFTSYKFYKFRTSLSEEERNRCKEVSFKWLSILTILLIWIIYNYNDFRIRMVGMVLVLITFGVGVYLRQNKLKELQCDSDFCLRILRINYLMGFLVGYCLLGLLLNSYPT